MTDALLLALLALTLSYDAWKDHQHRRQIDRLSVLLKAKDVPEFLMAREVENDGKQDNAEPDTTVPLEDATPEETIQALKQQ